MPSHCILSATDCSKPSELMKPSTIRWKTDLVSKSKASETEWPTTRKPMTKPLKGIFKIHDSQISKSPLEPASASPPSGSSNMTTVTLPVSPPKMDQKTPCTLSPSMLPQLQPMTPLQGHYHVGSDQYLLDQILNSWSCWSMHDTSRIGGSQPNSTISEPMTKKLQLQMQKSISSSKMLPLLSMIVPCVSNGSKHHGALKVSLTSRGWVPSLPMPSGALTLPMTKKTKTNIVPCNGLDRDIDSGERVMKWP
jgi:hypothetical protein